MKKLNIYLSLFCILLLFSPGIMAQLIDNCLLKCSYNFYSQPDSENLLNKNSDLVILEIGKKSSLFYSELKRIGDSIMAEDEKTANTQFIDVANTQKYNTDSWSIIVAKNYPVGQVTTSERILQLYKYNEELITQNWVITSDTTQILGMPCIKATTNFRGRDYEAWFTNQIPTVHGPWKFYGLPGLIIKVYDTKKQFVFELVSFTKMPSNSPMIYPMKEEYLKVNRKQLWDLQQMFHEDQISFIENNTPWHIKYENMPVEERKKMKMPYNPIELH
jgi:GLPGLI family protein